MVYLGAWRRDTPLQTGIPQSLGVAICLPARREFFPPCAPILHSLAATYLPPMFPAMHPSFTRYLRRHLFREQCFTLGKGSTTGIKWKTYSPFGALPRSLFPSSPVQSSLLVWLLKNQELCNLAWPRLYPVQEKFPSSPTPRAMVGAVLSLISRITY